VAPPTFVPVGEMMRDGHGTSGWRRSMEWNYRRGRGRSCIVAIR
jgi:hypothetical protein